jgi:DNA polymerase-1
MVLSVDYAKGTYDVYDITIPDHHCFIANGVCVHNSSEPNFQNNPKRSKAAGIIRKLIAAPPGHVLIAIDQSQAELRWCAHLSEDPEMMRVYQEGDDIHLLTAEAISGKSRKSMKADEKSKLRFQAKAINFGVIYLMSPFGFVNHAKLKFGLIIDESTATQWIKAFFDTYKMVPDYHKRTIEFGREHGYVVSPFGRRRRLPELNESVDSIRRDAERQAVNHPIQHASSETVLLAAREILRDEDLPKDEIRIVNVVHDELILEVVDDPEKIVHYAMRVKEIMEHPPLHEFGIDLKVPLQCDVKVGRNLAEMEELNW